MSVCSSRCVKSTADSHWKNVIYVEMEDVLELQYNIFESASESVQSTDDVVIDLDMSMMRIQ